MRWPPEPDQVEVVAGHQARIADELEAPLGPPALRSPDGGKAEGLGVGLAFSPDAPKFEGVALLGGPRGRDRVLDILTRLGIAVLQRTSTIDAVGLVP